MSHYGRKYSNQRSQSNLGRYEREGDAPRSDFRSHRGNSDPPRQSWSRRGQPRGRGGQTSRAATELTQPATDTTAPVVIPRPQHLSKTSSKEKNDPLFHEAWFPEGGDEFVQEPDIQYVQSGCDDLPIITEITYKTAVSTKVGFARRVPESVLAYYLAVHTKARLLEIQAENQFEVTPEEERYIQQVKQGKYTLPELFTKYLDGFGNTTIPSGRDLKFRILRPPPDAIEQADGKRGWFEVVNQCICN